MNLRKNEIETLYSLKEAKSSDNDIKLDTNSADAPTNLTEDFVELVGATPNDALVFAFGLRNLPDAIRIAILKKSTIRSRHGTRRRRHSSLPRRAFVNI